MYLLKEVILNEVTITYLKILRIVSALKQNILHQQLDYR